MKHDKNQQFRQPSAYARSVHEQVKQQDKYCEPKSSVGAMKGAKVNKQAGPKK